MKKWIKSAAGKVTIILVLLCIVMFATTMIINKNVNVSKESISLINNILIGLATNLLGIVVTISFVQYFLDKQDLENEKKEEIAKIKRYDKYMEILINLYLRNYIALSTRITDRRESNVEDAFNHKFMLSDMADMYKPSLFINEDYFVSTIELFFQSEERLNDYMLKMLENIDFKYNETLCDIIQDFVIESATCNVRGQILGNRHKINGNKMLTDDVVNNMLDDSVNWIEMYEKGELFNNIMWPYIVFYYSIQEQVKRIKCYKEYMNGL